MRRDRQWMIRAVARLGMSQAEFARQIGIARCTVYRWGQQVPLPKVVAMYLKLALDHDDCKERLRKAEGMLRKAEQQGCASSEDIALFLQP